MMQLTQIQLAQIVSSVVSQTLTQNVQQTANHPVLWSGTRVTCEMVSDGGERFIPAGIVGLNTLSLLLSSLAAHDRATEDNHKTEENQK